MREQNIGATVACCIVLLGFLAVCGLMVTRTVPDSPTLQILIGSLGTMAANALYFFTGSTASSRSKDKAIAEVATNAAKPQP